MLCNATKRGLVCTATTTPEGCTVTTKRTSCDRRAAALIEKGTRDRRRARRRTPLSVVLGGHLPGRRNSTGACFLTRTAAGRRSFATCSGAVGPSFPKLTISTPNRRASGSLLGRGLRRVPTGVHAQRRGTLPELRPRGWQGARIRARASRAPASRGGIAGFPVRSPHDDQ